MFERQDWTLFRSLSTLGQKAGVSIDRIPMLIAKELADNALDAAEDCCVGLLKDGNGFFVEDDGGGFPGDDAEIAALFSINRPLTSSKLLRLPTRGAMGNGLRVVAGSVLCSAGTLVVATRGRTLRLVPQDDGSTQAEADGPSDVAGTRIEVRLGHPFVVNSDTLMWAWDACLMAGGGPRYKGRTSPHWYDPATFFELLQAAGRRTVRDLIAEFDGCSEPKAGKIAAPFKGRAAGDLDRAEAASLLEVARGSAKPVRPERLGGVGPIPGLPDSYAKSPGALAVHATRDGGTTYIPIIVEMWGELGDDAGFGVFVNRTPVAADIEAHHHKDQLWLTGCGLDHSFKVGRVPPTLILNIETPYMPITSDGKAPDLQLLLKDIAALAAKVVRRARRSAGVADRGMSQKDAILACLDDGIAKAGGGSHRFGQRQLFYAIRDLIKQRFPGVKEPTWSYFCDVVTGHEDAMGRDVPGMYRDNRGVFYHPHTGEEIPLGTLNVERYRRPEWSFNKVLYCEKEGFFPLLKDVAWPERHDCALMTSKGFASRAARDIIDLLGDTGEELYFFCIHDADAAGTMIYQALQEGTRARPGRKVHIVNLGLEPEEALAMGLTPESVEREKDKTAPVAGYVREEWRKWLQSHRVELNSMTTPQFLEWLDRKFADRVGKVVPPAEVLIERLEKETRYELERRITRRILRRARVGARIEAALARRRGAIRGQVTTIRGEVERQLATTPNAPWHEPVCCKAAAIAREAPSETAATTRT